MKSVQGRSLLDHTQTDDGVVLFGQPDNDRDCETQLMIPEARWEAFGSPVQVTVTIETGDQLNNGPEPVTDTGVVTQQVAHETRKRSAFSWPVLNGVAGPTSLSEAVGLAGGAFSVCWDTLEHAGVFDDQYAREVHTALMKYIEANYVPRSPGYRVGGARVGGQTTFGTGR